MSGQSYLEKEPSWRKLKDSGLRDEGNIDGLCRGATTFLGYLEDFEGRYFKSKDVSKETYKTVSLREVGSGLAQIKNDLGLEQEEFNKWYWGSSRESSFDAEKIRSCLSERSDYTFAWD